MIIYRGYQYELDPNNHQRTLLAKHAGCARFVYNWGLEQRIKFFYQETGKNRFTNYCKQLRELTQLKKTEFSWMYELSSRAPQEALEDLDRAFANFRRGRKKVVKIGFPKFKKNGHHESFRLKGTIKIFEKKVQLPKLGRLRLKEKPRILGRILSATVSRKADHWFVSFCVEQDMPVPSPNEGPTIGVDLGITKLATLSDDIIFENPKSLHRNLRKLRRLSKQLSRKQKGSKNRLKATIRLARKYWRVRNIRVDSLHKVTTYLAKNHSQIIIENLNVQGLMKNKRLSRAISDVGFFEFRRQLEYKTQWYGSQLMLAPRFFPSSKRCSRCGTIKHKLALSERVFLCESCGLSLSRDLNAAKNLVAASWAETLNACLEMGGYRPLTGQCPSMKQEPNTTRNRILDG